MDSNENKELSLMRLCRLYLPKYLKMLAFWGISSIIITSVLLLSYLGGFAREGTTAAGILIEGIRSWLLVSLLHALIMLFMIYRGRSYYSVFFQKGYCEEYAEAYRSATINVGSAIAVGVRLNLSAIYDNIDMPQKADELLEGLDYAILRSKNEKRMYYNNRMALLLARYRTREAYDIYNEAAMFMGETFASGGEVQKSAVDDTYLELLFQMGKYNDAMQYFEHVIKPQYSKKSYKFIRSLVDCASPMGDGAGMMGIVYTTVACGCIINGHPDKAEEYEQLAINEIEKKKHYDFAWQKQHCLGRVSARIAKAREYAEYLKRVSDSAGSADVQQ